MNSLATHRRAFLATVSVGQEAGTIVWGTQRRLKTRLVLPYLSLFGRSGFSSAGAFVLAVGGVFLRTRARCIVPGPRTTASRFAGREGQLEAFCVALTART